MKLLIIVGLALMLITFGCVSGTQNQNPTGLGGVVQPDGSVITDGSPAGTASAEGVNYVPFTLSAYNKAKADGKTIFLEFYANWCPICKTQDPKLKDGLAQISNDNLVAFQVNYKDSETDADETALAKKFNVTYQHTHVVTNNQEQSLLKSQEEWSAQDVVEKLGVYT